LGTNTQYLKNKRILITAGPTWVPIDCVRVISNIATGETGILLAERLQRLGAKITLLIGPVSSCCLNRNIRLIHFSYFSEFKKIIMGELKNRKYDAVIHSAAVSDYRPLKIYSHKVKSGIKHWQINLVPAEKIIDALRKIAPDIFLVGFKFEPKANKEDLMQNAKALIQRCRLNLAVANTIKQGRYKAYIVNKNKIRGPFSCRDYLARGLIEELGEIPCKN